MNDVAVVLEMECLSCGLELESVSFYGPIPCPISTLDLMQILSDPYPEDCCPRCGLGRFRVRCEGDE